MGRFPGAGRPPEAMASEMRRAAKALVERTPAEFATAHGVEEALLRLRASPGLDVEASGDRLAIHEKGRAARLTAGRFEGGWVPRAAGSVLAGDFVPSPGIHAFLRSASVGLALLMGASLWTWFDSTSGGPLRYLLALCALFAVLGFPIAILAVASQKEAAQARVAKAVRAALEGDAGNG